MNGTPQPDEDGGAQATTADYEDGDTAPAATKGGAASDSEENTTKPVVRQETNLGGISPPTSPPPPPSAGPTQAEMLKLEETLKFFQQRFTEGNDYHNKAKLFLFDAERRGNESEAQLNGRRAEIKRAKEKEDELSATYTKYYEETYGPALAKFNASRGT